MSDSPHVHRYRSDDESEVAYGGPVAAQRETVAYDRTAFYSPATIVTAAAGVLFLVIGLIAIARGGLGGPIDEPVVDVLGMSHTPLLGLCEVAAGLLLLISAFSRSRSAAMFFATLILVAGIVIVATPESFDDTFGADAAFGWFAIVVSAVVLLVAAFAPSISTRSTHHRVAHHH